jgi:hypothetical protein|tara:strand:+ start:170 stop:691 length:522 start_codon:yes stop_codon:yes gene_type:complete
MSTLKVNEIQDTSGNVRRGIQTYAIICDKKANGADAGSITSGAWRTRDLNTEIADPDSIVSISSNQFTLGAGSYLIEFRAPAFRVNSHQVRLYNATTSAEVEVGSAAYQNIASNSQGFSEGAARVTITGDTSFEIQHRVSITNSNTYGAGVGVAGGLNWASSIYTVVKIYKEA